MSKPHHVAAAPDLVCRRVVNAAVRVLFPSPSRIIITLKFLESFSRIKKHRPSPPRPCLFDGVKVRRVVRPPLVGLVHLLEHTPPQQVEAPSSEHARFGTSAVERPARRGNELFFVFFHPHSPLATARLNSSSRVPPTARKRPPLWGGDSGDGGGGGGVCDGSSLAAIASEESAADADETSRALDVAVQYAWRLFVGGCRCAVVVADVSGKLP